MSKQQSTRVVVIGGGYAGVLAANRLRTATGLQITLINPRPEFVERIRLHQLVAGNDDATEDYHTLLGGGIKLVVDDASRIDTAARRIELATGATLDYDYLIYAVGSTAGVSQTVPGAAEFAYPLAEFEHAERLRARMQDVPAPAPVVVVGGGLTGIEAAAELAEAGWTLTLIGDQLGPSLGASARHSVAKRLAELGVTVMDGPDARVSAVAEHAVTLAGGRVVPSAVTVWTAGFGVPGLAGASGLATDQLGRLLTDETLTSVDDPCIVAAGDAAAPSGLPLRMSCQAAGPMGAQAADTVLSRIAGTAPAVLNQAFAGQCISLGRGGGTVQISHTDDTPRRAYIGGRSAAFIKEQVCKGTLTFARREARKPGSYFWLKAGNRRRQLKHAAGPAAMVP